MPLFKLMNLQWIPLDTINSILVTFLGPFSQAQLRKTCKSLYVSVSLDPYFFKPSGTLRVWRAYKKWTKEEPGSELGLDLKRLLFEQSGITIYSDSIFSGAWCDFDPNPKGQLLFKMQSILVNEPLLLLDEIDPEVLAILVSKFPKDMLGPYWSWKYFYETANSCNLKLLSRYRSSKRARALLRAVFRVQPFSIPFLLSSTRFLGFYLHSATIKTVIKMSKIEWKLSADRLDRLLPYLNDTGTLRMLFKIYPDNAMIMSFRFLEASVKLNVGASEVKRCASWFHFHESDDLDVNFKHALLKFSSQDEALFLTIICRFKQSAKGFRWTDDDDRVASDLGYSVTFRGMMNEVNKISS